MWQHRLVPVSTAQRIVLRPPEPFELRLALFGHGFIDLAPHRWNAEAEVYETALLLDGVPCDVSITSRGGALEVRSVAARRLQKTELVRLRDALSRMLQLHEDLSEFWTLCARVPRLRWVKRRGAGRLLRSSTVFEDLTKLLMTTNCSWAATRGMVLRLSQALGPKTPSGANAFPPAALCAAETEAFYRDVVRAGYRAGSLRELARGFASGRLRERDFELPKHQTDELRRRVLDLPGFAPYAAGQALRIWGHYADLALDSWCRAELARRKNRRQPPSDRAILREYSAFGSYRGLALWMDLTARWHQKPARAATPLLSGG